MDLQEFKSKVILEKLGINLNEFGPIFSFIDFGNVNYWFEKDRQNIDGTLLEKTQKFNVNVEKLYDFANVFSLSARFYYGVDPQNRSSVGFVDAVRKYFGKRKVITKPIQKIKHYLEGSDLKNNTRSLNYDTHGAFVRIPKCNFDVEICVDAIRLAGQYQTICLFSSDADFIRLCEYLKKQGKRMILIKGGFAQTHLISVADIVVNAQDIKQYITQIKAKI